MPLAAWIMSAVGPTVIQGLLSLGVGFVTYKGVDVALNGVLDKAASSFSGLTGDVLAILSIAGVPTAMSIISGGLVARLTLIPLKRMRFK